MIHSEVIFFSVLDRITPTGRFMYMVVFSQGHYLVVCKINVATEVQTC